MERFSNMKQVDLVALLNEMTLDEKIGQLVQLTPDFFEQGGEITGPVKEWELDSEQLSRVGSVLGTQKASQVYNIQKEYLEQSRLKIPLLFMADIIHGYETIFPIPLAMASSFDEAIIKEAARLSAHEGTNAGIHVTFSPNADYVKDARWGRVMETNGEDPILSAALTRAFIEGYQGTDLAKDKNSLAACVKHFIGYGAAQAGRDYNTVDISDIEMYQNYLPAFKAAIDAGVKLVMTSFNTIQGIPVSGNKRVIQKTLRQDLNFEGVLISDWASIAELVPHGVAKDGYESAELAFDAGVDIDMMSDSYLSHLNLIVNAENLDNLNESVLRVLNLKNALGLFEDPYRGLEKDSLDKKTIDGLRDSTRKIAEKSIVLLKNDGILPLKNGQNVGLIGPKATSQDILGAWSWMGQNDKAISLADGLASKSINLSTLDFSENENITDEYIEKAKKLAKELDIVIIAVGEKSDESGEGSSLVNIELSRKQDRLIQEISKINAKTIVIVFSGRPLALSNINEEARAIIQAWFPGSEGGNALANILMGGANPQAKLPMSFPRSVGQLPNTYAQMSTGRPKKNDNKNEKYISQYLDELNTPLYPFGHGLSYSEFTLEHITLSKETMTRAEAITVGADLKNISHIKGSTVVQLYLQDVVAQVTRPMRELKKWSVETVNAKDEKEIEFIITEEDLAYVHSDLTQRADVGEFKLYLGFDSQSAMYIGSIHLTD
ncbi:MAG: glycoside hydrolase family 3 N-terminal domain-containing protein [Ruoffia tabacinasalis]